MRPASRQASCNGQSSPSAAARSWVARCWIDYGGPHCGGGAGLLQSRLARTVTWKVFVAVLPATFFAVQVTVVGPSSKRDPEAGLHETVASPVASRAVGKL